MRDGFTLVEMVVALLILTMGVIALAGSTGLVALQLQAGDIRAERHTARQQVVEQLRVEAFDNVLNRDVADAIAVGDYSLWWEVSDISWTLKEVDLYASGPAFRNGRRQPTVVDTLTLLVRRPVQ